MKRLSRMLLINWLYYEKLVLELDDINYITGKNASGKSTFLDALMIVLLGEANKRNFNKAANESSERTLEGYLRADMDKNNPRSRKGRSFCSYIACEFYDARENKPFTLGIIFDCYSAGDYKRHFFSFKGYMPEDYFIKPDKHPMNTVELRLFLERNYKGVQKIYDTDKQYRDDVMAMWNVHVDRVFPLLKRGVFFKPINDIRKFITENLYDLPNKPDIVEMRQNIRDYQRMAKIAEDAEEKRGVLLEISRFYQNWQQSLERLRIHKYLIARANMEATRSLIDSKMDELKGYRNHYAELAEQYAAQEKTAEKLNRDKDALIAKRANSDIEQERLRLEEQRARLENEIGRAVRKLDAIMQKIRTEALFWHSKCDVLNREAWIQETAFESLKTAAGDLQHELKKLERRDAESFITDHLPHFKQVWQTMRSFCGILGDISRDYERKRDELKNTLDANNAELSRLERGIKAYPKHVMDFKAVLEQRLSGQFGHKVEAYILADLLEVSDSAWQGAIEGYLNTQRFYILVKPEYYAEAGKIYNSIKRKYHSNGLVDIAKLSKRESIECRPGSLAEKITADNDMAQLYVNYLLGRVMCCDDESQLNNYATSITAEGMYYKSYVKNALSHERMRDAYIGKRALELRQAALRQTITEQEMELKLYKKVVDCLKPMKEKEPLFTESYAEELSKLPDKLGELQRRRQEREEIIKASDRLDLTWLAKVDKQIEQLRERIKAADDEKSKCNKAQGGYEEKIRLLEQNTIPELNDKFIRYETELEEGFDEEFVSSSGDSRYAEELARLKTPKTIVKNFGDQLSQNINKCNDCREALVTRRTEYINRFPPCAFRPDAGDNIEFDEQLTLLQETLLPQYAEKIKQAHESALEQFQNDFIAKITSNINEVHSHVDELNRAIRDAHFGGDRYRFIVEKNPAYAEYYNMITDPDWMEASGGLFSLALQNRYGSLIASLFNELASYDDADINSRKKSELEENIERYTDFRTYLSFDLETTDINGKKEYLSKTLNTKSGGETQTPFYIAVLASFAEIYKVRDRSSFGNTMRLVVFDEAFNKMDSERIIECIRLLRKMGLQAIFSTPPDKLPDIMPEVDRTLLAINEKYHMQLVPWTKELEEKVYEQQ